MYSVSALPIDLLLPDLVRSLQSSNNLVIEAPPGAGKTTRVPPALLDAGLAGDREVWVLEPRRLAARMSARRVAEERGEKLGETIGYQVRFDEISGARTRLRFLTEGVLTRKLLNDPQLSKAGIVILDEFHERHLQADIALALVRRLQQTTRPDLKLVAMSATLNAAPIATYLGDCPVLRSEGKRFEVAIEHAARHDERPLAEQVASALQRLLAETRDGDVLVFLPGAAEIRRAQAACGELAAQHDLLMLPLHGELPAAEQDRAVHPASQRKVILSTNVAETSITIDGVVAVIDSGLARIAEHSPWSGLPRLNVARISKAAAIQRAGRAGRTRPGRCVRLFTAQDLAARAEHETPEIERLDLAEPALELHAAGIRDLRDFAWFDAPSAAALAAAEKLLHQLGAIDRSGNVTGIGQKMLRYPLHPRQSRMLVEAETRNVFAKGCLIAALIGERDIRQSARFGGNQIKATNAHKDSSSDLLELFDLFVEAERAKFAPEKLRAMNLDAGAVMAVERVRQQLLRLNRQSQQSAKDSTPDAAILISVLAGYPDRVARRRKKNDAELLLASGGAAQLSRDSAVRSAEFIVAVDIEERREANRGNAIIIRTASAIEPDWLLDLFSDEVREVNEIRWNATSERVETSSRLLYDQLVIDESRPRVVASEEASQKLAEAALNVGLRVFVDENEVRLFLSRVAFVAQHFPEAEMPALTESNVSDALVALCAGRSSFTELKAAARNGEFHHTLQTCLTPEQKQLLAKLAPERISIAGRRNVRVNYEADKAPWIESRLQDFFGMKQSPMIASGRVAIVLHLLAPNQRPVQVTTDLAGFWQRTYPQVRRELMRRYPKHAWPEDPLQTISPIK